MAKKGLRSWVQGELGRYCKQAKSDGSYPKVWPFQVVAKREKIIQNACPLQKQERCPKGSVRVP